MRQIAPLFAPVLLVSVALLAGCGQHSEQTSSSTGNGGTTAAVTTGGKKVTICLLPKKKGLAYFTSCDDGAEQAAKELGDVNLIYDGPTDGAPEKAASMIETWTLKGADAICVSPNDPSVLAPAMKAAKDKGTHVLTWDADGQPNSREFFVNQATSEQIGDALVDAMAKDLGGAQPVGKVAIVTATLTAANQNEWIAAMKERLKKYPQMQLVAVKPCNEDQSVAFQVTQDLMKTYPDLKGIFGIDFGIFSWRCGGGQAGRQNRAGAGDGTVHAQ